MLRGNSVSGKLSVAAGIRERFGRGLAWPGLVGQDNLRRIVPGERDRTGAVNIGLIATVARYALDAGYHMVVEGILYVDRHGDMLARLRTDHRRPTHAYYLHVPFEQTLARHAAKPIANDVGEPQLRDWHRELDLLPGGIETVIGADSTLNEMVDRIMQDTGPPALRRSTTDAARRRDCMPKRLSARMRSCTDQSTSMSSTPCRSTARFLLTVCRAVRLSSSTQVVLAHARSCLLLPLLGFIRAAGGGVVTGRAAVPCRGASGTYVVDAVSQFDHQVPPVRGLTGRGGSEGECRSPLSLLDARVGEGVFIVYACTAPYALHGDDNGAVFVRAGLSRPISAKCGQAVEVPAHTVQIRTGLSGIGVSPRGAVRAVDRHGALRCCCGGFLTVSSGHDQGRGGVRRGWGAVGGRAQGGR